MIPQPMDCSCPYGRPVIKTPPVLAARLKTEILPGLWGFLACLLVSSSACRVTRTKTPTKILARPAPSDAHTPLSPHPHPLYTYLVNFKKKPSQPPSYQVSMIRSNRLQTLVSSAKPSRVFPVTTIATFPTHSLPSSLSTSQPFTTSSSQISPAKRSSHLDRGISTLKMTSSAPTEPQKEIARAFRPSVLSSLRDFWFHGLDESDLVLPPMSAAMRWFRRSDEFDQAC